MAAVQMTPQHPKFQALKQQAFDRISGGDLEAKSLVVWGGKDPQVPLGLGEQFNDMLVATGVETKIEIIDDAGHAPFVEFPDVFNDLVIDYCRA